jgi:hypothetical protein|uniref:Uncharacterized protein n=1 Tax=Zea mays TaxID=4577 RepID=B4FC72_MAIZE|nr:unknown [Zea mays]
MRPRRVMLVRVSSLVKPRLMVRHVFEVYCVGNHVLIEGVSRSMHSKILSSPSLPPCCRLVVVKLVGPGSIWTDVLFTAIEVIRSRFALAVDRYSLVFSIF